MTDNEHPCAKCCNNAEILSASTLDEALEAQAWNEGFDAAQDVLLDQHKRILALEELVAEAHDRAVQGDWFPRWSNTWAYYKAQPLIGFVKEDGKQAHKVEIPRSVADAIMRENTVRRERPARRIKAEAADEKHPHTCEAEFIQEAGAYTPCRCDWVCDRCGGKALLHEVFSCQGLHQPV